jgi:hypothetical protein
MIDEYDGARLAQVVGRAEADDAALVLCLLVHPAARGAVERHFCAIAREKILPEILAEIFEVEAEMPDDREIPQYRVLLLRDVVNDQDDQPADQQQTQDRADAVGHHIHHAVHPAPMKMLRECCYRMIAPI